jgi:bifunctional DNA-binding transcriptional regulator/antitoxin component of YhaV-PrlF toxin-antitoxin module
MESPTLSDSTISKGYLTVVPKHIRTSIQINVGDVLSWSIEGDRIVVKPRRRKTIRDIVGLVAHGGGAGRTGAKQGDGAR